MKFTHNLRQDEQNMSLKLAMICFTFITEKNLWTLGNGHAWVALLYQIAVAYIGYYRIKTFVSTEHTFNFMIFHCTKHTYKEFN